MKPLLLLILLLAGCTPDITEDDVFKTGNEVPTPYQCYENGERTKC